jgi:hypothetical protein
MQPQDHALEVLPGTPVTNTEIHLIAHTTQGQTSSKLTETQSRLSDFPLLCHALRGQPRLPPSTAATTNL